MRNAIYISILAVLSACALPAHYGLLDETGGYADEKLDDQILIAHFAGNHNTEAKNAEVLSHFRGIEYCLDKGNLMARFWGTTDRSIAVTVAHTAYSTYTMPSYFTGPVGSYAGVWGTSYGAAAFGNATTWNQTFEYPTFDTAYSCAEKSFSMGVALRQLSRDDMKRFVSDLMEAVQVENVPAHSINLHTLRVGDIITKMNNVRIRTVAQIGINIDTLARKDGIHLTIIREGKTLSVTVKAVESSGETRALNRSIIAAACATTEASHRPLCSYSRRR